MQIAPFFIQLDLANHLDHLTLSSSAATSDISKMVHDKLSGTSGAASEIDRIMAKIEQAGFQFPPIYLNDTQSGQCGFSVFVYTSKEMKILHRSLDVDIRESSDLIADRIT